MNLDEKLKAKTLSELLTMIDRLDISLAEIQFKLINGDQDKDQELANRMNHFLYEKRIIKREMDRIREEYNEELKV